MKQQNEILCVCINSSNYRNKPTTTCIKNKTLFADLIAGISHTAFDDPFLPARIVSTCRPTTRWVRWPCDLQASRFRSGTDSSLCCFVNFSDPMCHFLAPLSHRDHCRTNQPPEKCTGPSDQEGLTSVKQRNAFPHFSSG